MYESKRTPGKKFGSIFAGKKYDQDHTEDGMHTEGKLGEQEPSQEEEMSSKPLMEEDEDMLGKHEENDKEEHPVVTEHGKAHKVVIHHDEASKRHTIQSHHSDGHVHSAAHDSAEKAHHEARRLAGVGADGQKEEHESPFHTGKAEQGAPSEEYGFAASEPNR